MIDRDRRTAIVQILSFFFPRETELEVAIEEARLHELLELFLRVVQRTIHAEIS